MKTIYQCFKYSIILPLIFIQFSCDETTTSSTVHNGDVIGSWMLTELTGTYTYTIDIPGSESGLTWNPDTSFGIKLRINLMKYYQLITSPFL